MDLDSPDLRIVERLTHPYKCLVEVDLVEAPGPGDRYAADVELGALGATWNGGGTALGAWMMLREPLAAEVAATAGYDYVCVDCQHGLADEQTMTTMILAIARTGASPLVRVAANEAHLIGRALDAGAVGVIVPMVNTAAQARAAVAACRYAPEGTRSIGPMLPGTRYGGGYVPAANRSISCIVMIETREALEAVEEIVAVPGVDAVYVGPADLSLSLGLRPGVDQPDAVFHEALATIVAACQRHGVVPGVHANAELAAARHAAGFRMITVGFDHASMFLALRNDLATARTSTTS